MGVTESMKSAPRYLLHLAQFVVLLLFILPVDTYALDADVAWSAAEPPPVLLPQHLRFEHLTTEQGLSSDIIWSILQDSSGFIWIGTLDGLNRFDGDKFKIYKHNVNDPNSLGDNSVQVLIEDGSRNLWIGSWGGGLSKFNLETEQFTQYKHNPDDPQSLSSNRAQAIIEDQNGVIWVGTADGLNKLDPATATFTLFKNDPNNPNSLSHNNIQALYEDKTGVLWIGTNGGGLNRFDRDTGLFTHFKHDQADPTSLSNDRVWKIYEDRSGDLWIGTIGGGLNQYNQKTGEFIAYQYDPADPNSLSSNNILSIVEDQKGVLWVGGQRTGLNQFDRNTGKFIRYLPDPNNPHSLSHDGTVALFVDQVGSLWIGTNGGGINRIDRDKKNFTLIQHNPALPDSLSNNDVRAIYEDRSGNIWIGTGNGLNRFDRQTGSDAAPAHFTRFTHDPSNPYSLSNNGILSIVEDQAGMLWVGTATLGLNKYDPGAGKFTHYTNDPSDLNSLSQNVVRSLFLDSSGTLWVGTFNGGLNQFDSETEQFIRYQYDPDDPNSLSDNTVMSITESPIGEIWIGTLGGLNKFDENKNIFTHYIHDPKDSHSLSHNSASSVFIDQEGVLWIGTNGGGLNKFDELNERFIHYREVDGLPSDTIMGITEDDEGFLWISTSQGISKFNPQLETFRNYDSSDGLQGNQFNFNSLSKSHTGELHFGGVNGLNAFYPSAIQDNPNIPPIVITDFQLANKPVEIGVDSVLKKSIINTKELVLSHQDRVISFEFAALNYTSPQKNRYRYKLEGFDDDWIQVDSDRRFVTYTNLDPGEYVFQVLGSNNDGVWNEDGTSIAITITPPWWETVWFRWTFLTLTMGAIAAVVLWQYRSLKNRESRLDTLLTERTKALSFIQAQMDILFKNSPLGIGLASVDGKILSANQAMASIFGYSEEEILETYVQDFFQSDEQREQVTQLLNTEKIVQVPHIELRRKDGTSVYINLTESILTWGEEQVFLGILHDTTAQVIAEEVLKTEAKKAAVTVERERLARELHDSVTQSLYTVRLIAESLPDVWETHPEEGRQGLNEILRINQGTLAEMRTLLLELRPEAMTDRPLGDLIRQLTDAQSARSNLPIVISTSGQCYAPPVVQVSFYRIAQEALNNIIKHARATKAWVNLRCSADGISMRIRDDGRGFDPEIRAPHNLGLNIMRERANEIDAELNITSQPDQGTQIQVDWQAS